MAEGEETAAEGAVEEAVAAGGGALESADGQMRKSRAKKSEKALIWRVRIL